MRATPWLLVAIASISVSDVAGASRARWDVAVWSPCIDDRREERPATSPAPRGFDRVQRIVHAGFAAPVRWFDRLFGDPRAEDEAGASSGRVRLGSGWDGETGWETFAKARVKLALPAAERRLNLLLGRVPEDEIVARQEGDDRVPDMLDDDEDDWLLGLELLPSGGERHRFAPSVGAKLTLPLEAYVKLRYRALFPLGRRGVLRWRLTPYWQDNDRRLGVRSEVDVDRRVGSSLAMRWQLGLRGDGRVEGTGWDASTTLYHRLGPRSALAHVVGARGETGRPVTAREYGYLATYRRRVARTWFFVELSGGAVRRRDSPAVRRETYGVAGVVVEVRFGDERRP